MSEPIELQSIEIVKNPTYTSSNPGQYVAKVNIRGGNHETQLLLTPEVSKDLLQYLAPLLVKHAQQAAEQVAATMQASIDAATGTKALTEAKAESEAA